MTQSARRSRLLHVLLLVAPAFLTLAVGANFALAAVHAYHSDGMTSVDA
jgi:hypothetical protein